MPPPGEISQNSLFAWGRRLAAAIQDVPFPPPGEAHTVVAVPALRNCTEACSNTRAIVPGLRQGFKMNSGIRVVPEKQDGSICLETQKMPLPRTIDRQIQCAKKLGADYMAVGILTETRYITKKQSPPKKENDEAEGSGKESPPETVCRITYSLAVEITDLDSGLVIIRKQRAHLERDPEPVVEQPVKKAKIEKKKKASQKKPDKKPEKKKSKKREKKPEPPAPKPAKTETNQLPSRFAPSKPKGI
jgi:hypothetical protein